MTSWVQVCEKLAWDVMSLYCHGAPVSVLVGPTACQGPLRFTSLCFQASGTCTWGPAEVPAFPSPAQSSPWGLQAIAVLYDSSAWGPVDGGPVTLDKGRRRAWGGETLSLLLWMSDREQRDPIYLKDKVTQRHSKEQFETAQKIEQEYSRYFTGRCASGLEEVQAAGRDAG